MKSATTGAFSGCLIWLIVFIFLAPFLCSAATMIGGFTSFTGLARQTVAPLICPDGTTSQFRTYGTTTTDNGHTKPATAFVLQCVDANGTVVKEDPVLYGFIWSGILALIGLVIAALLAFALAAPAGAVIARLFGKSRKAPIINIEPR